MWWLLLLRNARELLLAAAEAERTLFKLIEQDERKHADLLPCASRLHRVLVRIGGPAVDEK